MSVLLPLERMALVLQLRLILDITIEISFKGYGLICLPRKPSGILYISSYQELALLTVQVYKVVSSLSGTKRYQQQVS